MALKEPFKTLLYGDGSGIGHAPQFQEVAAVFITHRQRFATLALPVVPPTFEVHSPHVIGRLGAPTAPKPSGLRGSLPTTARFG